MPIELTFDKDSPEARKANQQARELLTARTDDPHAGTSPFYQAAAARVFNEIAGDSQVSVDVMLRIGYLVHALSFTAGSVVYLAGQQLSKLESIDPSDARTVVLQQLAAAMEEGDRNL